MNKRLEKQKRVEDVWKWLQKNVKTLDAVGGVKEFPDYPFLKKLLRALVNHRILIVAKSRQMLATWTICGWTLYRMLHDEPGIYLLLSKGARDTGELVKRLKIIIMNLPPDIREEFKIKNAEVVCDTESRILALPATEDAVRMHSPTAVFWDEMAFTHYNEAIWTAVKPSIDSGGSFFGVSTPNGTDNIFYQLYTDSNNGFGKIKLHWREHPLRDNKWSLEAKRGLSKARWRQEYEIDFNVLADRVYSEFETSLHLLDKPFRWNPENGPIFRGIDFGYRHPYVIWAQQMHNGELIVFDEWEGKDATVDEMAVEIKAIDRRHGITESDIAFSGCDPAGAAVSDTGISAVERLRKRGFKLVWRTSEIVTGIEIVKSLLKDAAGTVRLKFSPKVERLLYHLRHYRWKQDIGQPLKDDVHDHAMDALRYLAINRLEHRATGWTEAKVAGGKW